MKKIISILSALVLLISFISCTPESTSKDEVSPDTKDGSIIIHM